MVYVLEKNKNVEEIAQDLANIFSKTAVERDLAGGTAKVERDLIRESGLLKLLIPKEYGGQGGDWLDVLNVVHIFAKVDSSLAHLYGYHFVNLITPHLCGNKEQKEYYYKITAKHNYFWGNAFNPVDIKLRARKEGSKYIFNGVKTFCSGSVDSDYLLVSALIDGQEEPLLVVIPTNRMGISIKNDWDNFGQRQTDSGTVEFNNVVVEEKEVLRNGFNHDEFSRLRVNIASFVLNHLYLGIAEGAFEAALQYTRTQTRARTPHRSAIDDPIIQHHYGEFYVQLEAAKLLLEKSNVMFQNLWDMGNHISPEERKTLDDATHAAKVFITKAGLDITSRIFEVMGSRATANRYGFDRFWRNLRTMTLHIPVDITIQELGRHVLYNE
ncbi:acyl-CoA dehydrogenase family protein [Bacillus aquiflavi]|uniref:Dibenzothiophene monooxygenase n=1 Tax=Bacillus aquiflavi TaxID=2672567 RepID=A0A6B3W3R0_9BACI|nr:acyl-CoA dehydrogenase family protein [Bacillus aquiflavi]MBA4538264.1 acyl-CoA dehydrogenase family protein [Bacillus aquiflavi]NEY82583.1 acyl-CoA dehydrogenase [Bacillus aquiflavi]